MYVIVGRYCLVDERGNILIRNALLGIHDLKDETADTISSKLLDSANQFGASNKILGFMADNAPTNFGSNKILNSQSKGNDSGIFFFYPPNQ